MPVDFATIFQDGIAPGLIIFGALFFYFKGWPWYTHRQAAKDSEENRRHDQYIATQNRTNELIEQFTTAINGINITINGIGQVISEQTNRMDDYHEQVMEKLKKL